MMNGWSDRECRRRLLSQAAISTTALSQVDTRLPVSWLTLVLRIYLRYFQVLTGAQAIELYATTSQELVLDRLGCRPRLVSYHVPWQKDVANLARLVRTPHPRPITATVHMYEWASHFHMVQTGRLLSDTPGAVGEYVTQTEAGAAELALLDVAADNQITILFETVVDRELYHYLADIGQTRETYLFERLDFVRRLRDKWLDRHPGASSVPIGIVFNPWHAAIEMRGPQILLNLKNGRPMAEIRVSLWPLLERFYVATEQMVQRFYVGNSRRWEMQLPEMLQRGHFLDPDGIIPEIALLRRALRDQPQLAQAITLEASPQSALFSGCMAVRPPQASQTRQGAS